jgi:hypothetical protein
MHIRFDLMVAPDHNETRHPQLAMKDMGITYQHATPQSLGDQWWFWNCENVPDILPAYLTELKLDPTEAIGFGLSKEDAEKIKNSPN